MKPSWEIRLEEKVKKLWQAKILRIKRKLGIRWDEKTKTVYKSNDIT